VQEYANNVIHILWEVCSEHALPHPNIITESGRALTAHHAVLITDVIDHEQIPYAAPMTAPDINDPFILHNLWNACRDLSQISPVEAYHDAAYWLSEAQSMYIHGVLSLEQRAQAEQLYFAICRRIQPLLNPSTRAHRELLDELNEKLAEKFFLNFSLFQSLPDVWAIDQIFPIMPLHRLTEPPTSRVILQDLTCDSDGRIDYYIDREGVETTLPLPSHRQGEPYLLGIFLVGAYQEILGDMHNLFGDTNAVNVGLNKEGGYCLVEPEHGDTVTDLLRYVHFDPEAMLDAYRQKITTVDLSDNQRNHYLAELEAGLKGYTYLEN
jgi:arginine decarboxylase